MNGESINRSQHEKVGVVFFGYSGKRLWDCCSRALIIPPFLHQSSTKEAVGNPCAHSCDSCAHTSRTSPYDCQFGAILISTRIVIYPRSKSFFRFHGAHFCSFQSLLFSARQERRKEWQEAHQTAHPQEPNFVQKIKIRIARPNSSCTLVSFFDCSSSITHHVHFFHGDVVNDDIILWITVR